MDTHTIRFKAEKSTKNTVRFEEQSAPGKPPIIGTLYVQKWAVGDAEMLDITIGPAADSATVAKGRK